MGEVGVSLEEAFGGPRDIEWSFYKVGTHCIVQLNCDFLILIYIKSFEVDNL